MPSMADDASSKKSTPPNPPAAGNASPGGGGEAPGTGSPLDELENDPFASGADPFAGGDDPFSGEGDPFGGDNPFADGSFASEPPALMMAKFWIRQNALLSVGLAFAAGTLIGALKR